MAKQLKSVQKNEDVSLEAVLDNIYEAVLFVDMSLSILNKNADEVFFSDSLIYLKHLTNLTKSTLASFVISTKVAVWADEKDTKNYIKKLTE